MSRPSNRELAAKVKDLEGQVESLEGRVKDLTDERDLARRDCEQLMREKDQLAEIAEAQKQTIRHREGENDFLRGLLEKANATQHFTINNPAEVNIGNAAEIGNGTGGGAGRESSMFRKSSRRD